MFLFSCHTSVNSDCLCLLPNLSAGLNPFIENYNLKVDLRIISNAKIQLAHTAVKSENTPPAVQ